MHALWEGQLAAVAALRPAISVLAAAVTASASRLRGGGRLAYAGAGTSGRIGVQDGAELGPTFDWPPERLLFLMAGGEAALIRAAEGAEDRAATSALVESLMGRKPELRFQFIQEHARTLEEQELDV